MDGFQAVQAEFIRYQTWIWLSLGTLVLYILVQVRIGN
jgi:hypothetical protein